MPVKELPILITPTIASDPDRMAKAVMRNFDHLIGESGYMYDQLSVGSLAGKVQEAIEEGEFSDLGNAFDETLRTRLNEAGVGMPDGTPPAFGASNVRAQGGIGNWFIVYWDTAANNSGLTYEVHVHTSAGFVPGANTLVGTWSNPGIAGNVGAFLVRDFPVGHLLDGTANDPVKIGVTYRVKLVTVDADGVGPTSDEVTVTPIKVDADSIVVAGTIVGNLIAGATIVGGNIAGTTITADKLSVGTLSAITANLGTVNAGTINGLTITGGTIATSSGADRIVLAGNTPNTINFWTTGGAGIAGAITASNDIITITAPGGTQGTIRSQGVQQADGLWVGTYAPEPPTNYAVLYKSGNALFAKAPGRAAVQVVAL